jgi:hypothetical protein
LSAIFSECRRYRYRLERQVASDGPTIAFLLHNPSTADAENDDATSRRGISYARAWASSRFIFINPWAGVATTPRDLWTMADPVGPDNDLHIARAVQEVVDSSGFIVFGWGVISPPKEQEAAAKRRLSDVENLVRSLGCQVCSLGENKDGSPKHPLYSRADALLRGWPSRL